MFSFLKSLSDFGRTFSGAAALLGAGAQAYGAYHTRRAAQDQARFARRQAADRAGAIAHKAAAAVRERKRLLARQAGGVRAGYGASGVVIDEDSPGLFIAETRALGTADIANIHRQGQIEAQQARDTGRMQVRAYRKQGRGALVGGGLGIGAGLLGGSARNRLMQQKYGKRFGRWV